MKKLMLSFLLVTCSLSLYSQSSWHTLLTAPVADSFALRFDDIYFINPSTGWVITTGAANVKKNPTTSSSIAKIYRTNDGGVTWDVHYLEGPSYLRSIGFFDANTGILGTLDSNHFLYRTTNGGVNWTQLDNFYGPKILGVCGISVVDSQTIWGVGRYWGKASAIRSTDKGISWTSMNLNGLVNTLIDCKFWTPDSGIVVGGLHPNPYTLNGNAVILFTNDGGQNWKRVYRSNRTNEWCWKIFRVNSSVMFASIEHEGFPTNIVKSTDGGMHWSEINISTNNVVDLEGIGFLNANTGWVGGWGYNYHLPTYETTNSGVSWHAAGWGINMNRVRFLSDTLAYAVGLTVYKYTSEPIGIAPVSNNVPSDFGLEQNFPNPFNPSTTIRFHITKETDTKLTVYDELGRETAFLVNQKLNAGTYEINWNASNFQSGVYFCRLEAGSFRESKKIILMK